MRSIVSKVIAVVALVVGVVVGSAGAPASARPTHTGSSASSGSTIRVPSDWWA